MYISGNGELYDDEEIIDINIISKNGIEDGEMDIDVDDMELEDMISFWENSLRI